MKFPYLSATLAAAVAIVLLVVAPASATLTKVSGEGATTISLNDYGVPYPGTGVPHLTYASGQDVTGGHSEVSALVILNADGSLSLYADSSVAAYDNGGDDTLIGVVNESSNLTLTSFVLSGGSGKIYAFDGDGIGSYTGVTNSHDTSDGHYGGPMTYFTHINSTDTVANVNLVGGLAAGQMTYFSLETSPASIISDFQHGGGIAPEPASVVTAATGALMLLGYGWRRRQLALKK